MLIIVSMIFSCKMDQPNSNLTNETTSSDDVHSYSDISSARMTHLNLDLKVDFAKKEISGTASLAISKNGSDTLFLDSNGLFIESMKSGGKEVPYIISPSDLYLGSKIAVPVADIKDTLDIKYHTSPDAAALQWLDPQQTFGKKHPFLYTQGQAILTRTWIPIQDSPGIRFTYNAHIKVPQGLLALMSAENPQSVSPDGNYDFKMDQAIPAYLIALAVGNIAFHPYDNRSGVYAEPEQLNAAAREFDETPAMIRAAEALYGPYVWKRYDLLILPPAFPFGGMENPRLTFATPTVIAGDKSLSPLVAHELAHSWSGNLVTNATWNDFWLNEGFTVYIERRIVEKVKGKDYSDMNSIIGRNDLESDFKDFGKGGKETKLFLDLKGHNPDDAMTNVPYEKGYLFLVLLERTFGRDRLDHFLKTYFEKYKFKTITTQQFEKYLYSQFDPAKLDEIHVRQWLYQPGLPDNSPVFHSKLFDVVDHEETALLNGTSSVQYNDWDFNQWLYFLRNIKYKASLDQLNRLNEKYGFIKLKFNK
ncbi:MAG: hypothetical protein J5I59_08655 [Saprospiraceae bacterium]|nr:hypothetical protein [Saprospiraceae bacterium]